MASSASNIKQCCLKNCLFHPSLVINHGRVEVRAFEVKSKNSMAVAWGEGGSAVFHTRCWEALLEATKDSSSSITLSDKERSMVLDAKKTAEHHNSDREVSQEAKRIADILKRAENCIAFTGAGISTAAGIGDFRGKDGKWTEREKVKNYGSKGAAPRKAANRASLRPTYTHEALCKLLEMGLLKFIISQNTDGLHRLSGIPADSIAELHGNSFQEKCEKCGIRYDRGFQCIRSFDPKVAQTCPTCRIGHRTGRMCTKEGCGGYLMNTIINFGDYLEESILDRAKQEAYRADAVLVLGSTLMVSPANDLVTMGQRPDRLIICNRQTTPYDSRCFPRGSRVFGDCDNLMRKVMAEILPEGELQAWEKDRDVRNATCMLQRAILAKRAKAV